MPAEKTLSSLFLDTSFALALSIPRDQHHVAAVRWMRQVRAEQTCLITHTGVLFEIGNQLSRPPDRAVGTRALLELVQSPTTDVVEIDAERLSQALDLFASRPDKDWGLVDCASFVVMRERGLADALTADRHFEQAGFRALLHEAP